MQKNSSQALLTVIGYFQGYRGDDIVFEVAEFKRNTALLLGRPPNESVWCK